MNGAAVHRGIEYRVSIASHRFGAVHGRIRVANELLRSAMARRAHGDADARCCKDVGAFEAHRRRNRFEQPFGDAHRVACVANVLEKDGELVAAEPRQRRIGAVALLEPRNVRRRVVSSGCLSQPLGDFEQQAVADCVTEAVVDRLESIEIDEQNRKSLRTPRRVTACVAHAVHEQRAVRQPGQVIVKRIVQEALLRGAKARRHLVEGDRHRRRFGAAANRNLVVPVPAGDLFRRRRDVPQRKIDVMAEQQSAGDREDEDDAAGNEDPRLNRVDELLRRLPRLEQHQPFERSGVRAVNEWKAAPDVFRAADPNLRQVHRRRRSVGQHPGERRAFVARQAAAGNVGARHEVDLAMRHLRELSRHSVVEDESNRHRAEHFFGESDRLGDDEI